MSIEKNKQEKIKVSPFEFAIRSVAEPETLHQYEAKTKEEQQAEVRDKMESFFRRIKIKKQ